MNNYGGSMMMVMENEMSISKVLSCRPLLRSAVLIVVFGLCMATTITAAPLSEVELFFELNNTDGDLGIHSSFDGGPYVLLVIKDPNNDRIASIHAGGNLSRQGLTQLFFESAEPSFDELSPEKFFRRFPEGTYEITATTRKGKKLRETVDLSHVMAEPVDNVKVNGKKVAKDCDSRNLPRVSEPVVIDWDPVTPSERSPLGIW